MISFISRQIRSLVWPEEGNEGATEVKRHDLIGWSDELSADEDGGDGAAAAHPHEPFFDILALGIMVQLVHQWLHPQVSEKNLNGVA